MMTLIRDISVHTVIRYSRIYVYKRPSLLQFSRFGYKIYRATYYLAYDDTTVFFRYILIL